MSLLDLWDRPKPPERKPDHIHVCSNSPPHQAKRGPQKIKGGRPKLLTPDRLKEMTSEDRKIKYAAKKRRKGAEKRTG